MSEPQTGEHVKTILVVDYGNDDEARQAVEDLAQQVKDLRAVLSVVKSPTVKTAFEEVLKRSQLALGRALWDCEHFDERQWWKDACVTSVGAS